MANEPAHQPQWGSACSPLVILTDSDSDDIIGPGQSMTVTATFDRTISGSAKYSLDNGATYSNMSKVNSSTWNFTIAANPWQKILTIFLLLLLTPLLTHMIYLLEHKTEMKLEWT